MFNSFHAYKFKHSDSDFVPKRYQQYIDISNNP